MIVYQIINKINGKLYIGQTVQPLLRRWTAHCTKNIKINAIGKAIKKYGKENFEIKILCRCSTIEEMNHRESYYIKLKNTMAPNGYNLNSGGNGRKISDATRAKLSESHKGIKISDATKKKLSSSLRGKKKSRSHCRNISLGKQGSKHPMFGKTGFAHHLSRAVKCENDNKIFGSISEAAAFYNIADSSLGRSIRQNRSIKGLKFTYLTDHNLPNNFKKGEVREIFTTF